MQFITPDNINDFCDKVWFYVHKTTPASYAKIGSNGGLLTLRLTKHHRIETLSYTDNEKNDAGYHWWDFDLKKRQIYLLNMDYSVRSIVSLPYRLPDGSTVMKVDVHDGVKVDNVFYVLDISDSELAPPALSGQKMAYLFGESWKIGWKEKHFILFSMYNFNVYRLSGDSLTLQMILELQENLMLHPSIEYVILAKETEYLDDESILQNNRNEIIFSGTDFIKGPRYLLIELMDALIVEINHYQLKHDNTLPFFESIFSTVIEKFFKGRSRKIGL
jgi:hypothetical protein